MRIILSEWDILSIVKRSDMLSRAVAMLGGKDFKAEIRRDECDAFDGIEIEVLPPPQGKTGAGI